MKITVIINTFNEDKRTLNRAILSYLNQYNVEVELIISTLNTDKNLPWLKKNNKLKLALLDQSKHPGKSPQGSFIQLNNGLKQMTSDWFCFASGNDYAAKFKLSMEVKACLDTGTEICYSDYTSRTGGIGTLINFHQYDYQKHLKGNFVSDCALISRRLVDKYLPFKIEYNNYAYWDLWLRIHEGEGNVFTYLDVSTWTYIQRSSDMHIRRLSSGKLQNQARIDRQRMLDEHAKIHHNSGLL